FGSTEANSGVSLGKPRANRDIGVRISLARARIGVIRAGPVRAVAGRMRPLLVIALSGCSLYIAEPQPQGRPPPPPPHGDEGPDAAPVNVNMVRCEDGVVFGIESDPTYVPGGVFPGHGVGQRLTTCIADCRSSSAWCDSGGC